MEVVVRDETVLVITSDVAVGAATGAALGRAGFRVSKAGNGSAGVQRAVDEQPHAIVLDLRMGRGTGELALGCLARSLQTRRIPVVTLDDRAVPRGAPVARRAAPVRRTPFEPDAVVARVVSTIAAFAPT
jgi:DNA-binding response OmpR family regulator